MGSVPFQRDVGAYVKPVYAVANTTGSTDVNGITIDRLALDNLYLSGVAAVTVATSLGAGETVSVAIGVEDSPDGQSWAEYQEGVVNVIGDPSSTGAQTITDVATANVNLSGAQQYVRLVVSPDVGSTGVSLAMSGVLVLGGSDKLPA